MRSRIDTPLYKRLQRHPSPPNSEFERFVVGSLLEIGTRLSNQLREIVRSEEPSGVKLILGPNGNGKTLLNNMLKKTATEINIQNIDENNLPPSFTVLYSRVTLNELGPTLLGIELAKNLQRSYFEPPDITYSSIATRIIKTFAEEYKPPFHVRLAATLPKYLLKKAIRKYEEALNGLITTDEADPITELLDMAYLRIQKRLSRNTINKAFLRFSKQIKLSGFLRHFWDIKEGWLLTIRELNKYLYDDLGLNQSTGQPLDTIRAMAAIARNVDCKAIILMLDDFNLKEPPNVILPIADSLSEFENPRIFLIISAVEEIWRKFATADPHDLSVKQKIEIFGDPITLEPPTKHEIQMLFDKLSSLMANELRSREKWIQLNESSREEIIRRCPITSFREATKFIIDSLERYIRPSL